MEKAGRKQHSTDSAGKKGWMLSKQKKRRRHYGIAVHFMRAITDIKRWPPPVRRNGGKPVGYSKRAAFRGQKPRKTVPSKDSSNLPDQPTDSTGGRVARRKNIVMGPAGH
jgi:hypothetical protein